MLALLQRTGEAARGRLSRRIVLWVFISVIVIETIILIPSFNRREKELLAQLKEVSIQQISLILRLSSGGASDKKLFEMLKFLQFAPQVVGGAFFRADGTPLGGFGEPPEFIPPRTGDNDMVFTESASGPRYDLVCSPAQLKRDYILILRHDALPVRQELKAFILRIAGLVVIISIFVTAGAWFALNPIVVKPVLRLREDLVKAGEAIRRDQQRPEFYSASVQRQDELGEVISAFRKMYSQVADAINERKSAEKALQRSFKQVEAYSEVLNNELEKAERYKPISCRPNSSISPAGNSLLFLNLPARSPVISMMSSIYPAAVWASSSQMCVTKVWEQHYLWRFSGA